MRIGITCYPTIGGSGVVATELGKLLAERGHIVHFITAGPPFRLGKFSRNIYYHEVEVNSYSVFRYPPYDLTLASRIAQVAEREQLDLIHVHYAVPHAVCAYLAKKMTGDRLKIITTLHGTDITVLGYDETLKDIIKFGIENSDAVTAVSRDLIKQTYELLQVEKEIALIYNFVDKREYFAKNVEDIRKDYAPNGEKILIHISNFRPVKRVKDVVHIFAKVRKKIESKLIFIGEGPELPGACELAKQLGVREDIIFLGKQDDVATVISMADLMILPSEKESFGLAALEAMACGVPVIASNAGGLPEVVENGVTGFVFNIGDIENMAKQAIRLLSDETLYQELSKASVKRAYVTFCHETITSQYEDLYRKVTGTTHSFN